MKGIEGSSNSETESNPWEVRSPFNVYPHRTLRIWLDECRLIVFPQSNHTRIELWCLQTVLIVVDGEGLALVGPLKDISPPIMRYVAVSIACQNEVN